jgi:thiopeptide-type bacteriocin biosynthesis protein
MHKSDTKYEWLSAHIYYEGSAEHLLCQVIQPFVNLVQPLLHSTCPYFFIRYGEGGPHMRLRLHTIHNYIPLLKEALEASISCSNYTVNYIPYVPEIKRYGNGFTIALAETLFHASSSCSLQLIASMAHWDLQMALPAAWQMHIVFFHALNEDVQRISLICRQFVETWMAALLKNKKEISFEQVKSHMHGLYDRQAITLQKAAATLWQLLENREAPAPLQAYADACRIMLQQYKLAGLEEVQFNYAIRSLLHMTNNRLGIPNKEEPWCLFITGRSIQQLYENSY